MAYFCELNIWEFVTAMFWLGASSVDEMKGNEGLILNEDWH